MGFTNSIEQHLEKIAASMRQPLRVSFELLPYCNLACSMCFITPSTQCVQSKDLLPASEWLRIADEMRQDDCLFLLLTGGEIFLYPELEQLYKELYKKGFQITLNTNASLIGEHEVEWLAQYPPKCVSLSLYGASDEAYEKICKRKGIFTKVDRAIQLMLEKGIRIEAKTMVTPDNEDDIDNIIAYTDKYNIPHETAVYAYPPKRAGEKQTVRFTPEQAACKMLELQNKCRSHEENCRLAQEYLQKIENTKQKQTLEHKGFLCSATHFACWITWQGEMTPCAMVDNVKTYPFRDGFKASWENLKVIADQQPVSGKCSACENRDICTVCPASAYTETGSLDGTAEYLCRMTAELIRLRQQMLEDGSVRPEDRQPQNGGTE